MRHLTLVLAVFTALIATDSTAQMKPRQGGGPQRLQTQSQPPIGQARRIDRREATRLVERGQAVFIDVRSQASFDSAHIKGALSVPQSRLAELLSSLPRNKMLIPYCACHAEETAALTVLYLDSHGIKNAAALRGGWNEWVSAGLPVECSRVH